MIKQILRRFLALGLAVLMAVSLLPQSAMTVYAANLTGLTVPGLIASTNDVDDDKAKWTVTSGNSIYGKVSVSGGCTGGGQTITLELKNAKTVPAKLTFNYTVYSALKINGKEVSPNGSPYSEDLRPGGIVKVSLDGGVNYTTLSNIRLIADEQYLFPDVTVEVEPEQIFPGDSYEVKLSGEKAQDSGLVVEYRMSGSDTWSSEKPTEIGSYDVRVTRTGDAQYDAYEKIAANVLVIRPFPAEFEWHGGPVFTYEPGVTRTVTADIINLKSGEDVSLVLSGAAEQDAGMYTAQVSGLVGADSGKYTLEGAVNNAYEWCIEQAEMPEIIFPTAVYEGSDWPAALSEVSLVGGSTEYGSFAWAEPDQEPTYSQTMYPVIFTPSESSIKNYKGMESVTRDVELATGRSPQAEPDLTVTQPSQIGGKGIIDGLDTAMEWSTDQKNWTAVTASGAMEVEAGTYYVRYAETDDYMPGAVKTCVINAFVGTPEPAPAAYLNYRTEELTGLRQNTVYLLSGMEYTSDVYGCIGLEDNWFGTELELVLPGNGITTTDSEAQTVVVPERPAAPDGLSAEGQTAPGNADGKITGVSAKMEYRLSGSGAWQPCGGTEISGLAPGDYQVRYAAGDDSFSGAFTTVSVEEANCAAAIEGMADFGVKCIGYETPEAAALTVRNTGNVELTGLRIQLEGTDKDSFVLDDSGTEGAIAAGETVSFTIKPVRGLDAGSWRATLVVTGDGGIRETADVSFTVSNHTYVNYVSNGDATCTVNGTETAKCERCDETNTRTEAGSALGHSFTVYESNHDATCTLDGTETATCDRCDETNTRTETGSALGHIFINYVSNDNATCTSDETETATCDRCGITDTRPVAGSALGHSFTDYKSNSDATCTTDETETAKCDRCGITDTRPVPGSALGHSFTNYALNDDATCTSDGTETAKCDRCAETDTRTVSGSAKGHDWGEWVTVKDSTCTEKGEEQRTCKRCGLAEQRDLDEAAHSWQSDYTIDRQATCTEDGSKSIHCENCDAVKDSKTIPALGHSFTAYHSNGNATCTTDGTETAQCDRCAETDTRTEAGSVLGHSYTNYVSNGDATCTTDGTETAQCDRCAETDTRTEAGSALGHSYTNYVSNGDATCTTDGTETAQCERCGVPDTRPVPGSALGHSFLNYVSNDDATCTTDGTETAQCERCDETDIRAVPGSAMGHEWGEWETVKIATCAEDGEEQRSCKVCHEVEKRKLDAKEHSWQENYTIDREATCTEDGSKSIHCENCDAVKDIIVISALGHSFTNYQPNHDAGCTEDGTETAVCDRCTETNTRGVPGSATGHRWGDPVWSWNEDEATAVFVCQNDDSHVIRIPAGVNVVTTNATCTTDGKIVYTASVILERTKYENVKTIILTAPGHRLVRVEKKPATEHEDGNITYWYCSVCGKYFRDEACAEEITWKDIVIRATGTGTAENPAADQQEDVSDASGGGNAANSEHATFPEIQAPQAVVEETVFENADGGKANGPGTGDDTGMWLWIAALLLSGGVAGVLIRKRKTK